MQPKCIQSIATANVATSQQGGRSDALAPCKRKWRQTAVKVGGRRRALGAPPGLACHPACLCCSTSRMQAVNNRPALTFGSLGECAAPVVGPAWSGGL